MNRAEAGSLLLLRPTTIVSTNVVLRTYSVVS